jgi:hypothetical protein
MRLKQALLLLLGQAGSSELAALQAEQTCAVKCRNLSLLGVLPLPAMIYAADSTKQWG